PLAGEGSGRSCCLTYSTQRLGNASVQRAVDGWRVRRIQYPAMRQRMNAQRRRERQKVELVRRHLRQAVRDDHGHLWSSRRTHAATFVAATLALELLPLEGTLLLVTGAQDVSIAAAPAPLWYLAGTLLVSWAVGLWLKRRASGRLGLGRSLTLSFPLLFAS